MLPAGRRIRQRPADGPPIPARPYWDPALSRSRAERGRLIQKLHGAHLISWRLRARASVGVFCVGKKDGSLRLVLDGRIPSALHRRPPRSALSVPGALSRLLLSDDALALGDERDRLEGRDEGLDAGEPIEIEGSSADLTDGYYQFYSEKTASWFGLD